MFDSAEFLEEYRSLIPPLVDDRSDHLILDASCGKGTRVFDKSGREYIDFGISVGVSALGYEHPEMVEFHRKCPSGFYEGCAVPWHFDMVVAGRHYDISPAELGRRILSLMFPGFKDNLLGSLRFFADVTGGTGVNAACALALKARPGFAAINFFHAFHGRPGFAQGATCSKPVQRQGFPNFGPRHWTLPYPTNRERFEWALEMLNFIPLQDVSYVIYEPLQGEGGYRLPNIHLMEDLLRILRKEGIIVIADEVQTFARTGKWFAYQHSLIVPDIVICGKGLAGEVPLSAIGYNRKIFGFNDDLVLERGWHGGTYMNYPRGVGAAIMTLAVMEREGLVENTRNMGARLAEILGEYCGNYSADHSSYCLRTGTGLMQGLAFFKARGTPDPERRNLVLRKLREADPGILTHACGMDGINPTIRFAPPLTCKETDLQCLKKALDLTASQ